MRLYRKTALRCPGVLQRGARKIGTAAAQAQFNRATAPALRLAVKDSFAALSVNLKLVNESAADLFPV